MLIRKFGIFEKDEIKSGVSYFVNDPVSFNFTSVVDKKTTLGSKNEFAFEV